MVGGCCTGSGVDVTVAHGYRFYLEKSTRKQIESGGVIEKLDIYRQSFDKLCVFNINLRTVSVSASDPAGDKFTCLAGAAAEAT